MRLSVVAACLSLCLIGFSLADDARASIRKETNIPAEGLGPALNSLAKDRNFQIVYVTEEIANVHTEGAVGEFTTEEALKRLLTGTGLTYRYLDDKTVTIGFASAPRERSGNVSKPVSSGSDDANINQEGKKSSSQEFRVAQVGQNTPGPQVGDQSTKKGQEGLAEIVVTGRYEFLSADTSGATNLPLPIEQVPQSISLVSGDFIKAADLKTLGEIAEYTPGAIDAGNKANLASIIYLRGFPAGQAIDGIETALPSTTGTYEPDYAIFDRLEVVKGPSSVVYGVSSPGGLVNFVTKSAAPETPNYVSAQVGSWNTYRVEGQGSGAVDSDGHTRLIGIVVQEHGDSFLNEVSHTKTTAYAGINSSLTDSLSAYLHAGFERYVRTSFDGVLTEMDGAPAPLPRSFFLGAENMRMTTNAYHAEGGLVWNATDMLEVKLKGVVVNSKTTGYEPYGYSVVENGVGLDANGNFGVGVQVDQPFRNDNWGLSLTSLYKFDDLGLKNSFISLAVVRQENRQDFYESLYFGATPVNINAGATAINQAFNAAVQAGNPYLFSYIDHTATTVVSAQSVVQVLDPLSILVGVSYSKPDETVTTLGVPQTVSIEGRTSYRGAITYEVLPKTFAYVSYSQSFSAQLGITPNNTALPALNGTEYETGIKYRPINERLLLTGALFQITQNNLAEEVVVNGLNYFNPVGTIRNRGLELEATGRLTPQWQLNAGYAYLDPVVTQDVNPLNVGKTVLFLPKQTASVFTTYRLDSGIARGLSFGGGARYVGAERTAYDASTQDIPGYAVIDGTLSYEINRWLVQLNAHNLLDRHYFINNYQTLAYGNTVGEPLNVALSIRRTF